MNDFGKGFLAGFIGYWIGSLIDRTRFGIWVNNNVRIIKAVLAIKRVLTATVLILFCYYLFLVFQNFTS